MNTRRNVAQRLEEEIANAGAPSYSDQVPPLEKDANMEHAMVNPPPLMDENIRTSLLQMAQAITTKAQAATAQSQAMPAQANRVAVLSPHQKVTTMASRLRDFTRKNPLLYMSLRLMKTPNNSSMKSIR